MPCPILAGTYRAVKVVELEEPLRGHGAGKVTRPSPPPGLFFMFDLGRRRQTKGTMPPDRRQIGVSCLPPRALYASSTVSASPQAPRVAVFGDGVDRSRHHRASSPFVLGSVSIPVSIEPARTGPDGGGCGVGSTPIIRSGAHVAGPP